MAAPAGSGGSAVSVLAPNGRRHTVKVTPSTVLLQVRPRAGGGRQAGMRRLRLGASRSCGSCEGRGGGAGGTLGAGSATSNERPPGAVGPPTSAPGSGSVGAGAPRSGAGGGRGLCHPHRSSRYYEPASEGPRTLSPPRGRPSSRCAVAGCAESLAALHRATGGRRLHYVGNACWA